MVLEVDSEVNSGHFWTLSETHSRPISGNLIIILRIAFIWPWVGLNLRYMLNMGTWDWPGGYRYSPSQYPPGTHPHPAPPGTPLPAVRWVAGMLHEVYIWDNQAVGL